MLSLFRRGLFAVLALSLVFSANVRPIEAQAQSQENSRYAAIVIDAASGEVLFSRHADARRYPASLTKMMTLYLTFEALSQGRVKADDVLTVSPHAASQPPSKLGLAAGQTITLDDAMRATAVRSANDMAVAIAEHVGGSESRFTSLMTQKAQQLGMTQTRYFTANGLPDARQVTSARDQAILARAIMRDFPQYYSYFGLHDWAYNGRSYRNTNGLLPTGNGYDGMKTGYTNASGYNLAASAVRDGRRLITVVLGGRSSASRNAHVAELMDTGFEVERRRAQGESIQIAQSFFEQRGFGFGGLRRLVGRRRRHRGRNLGRGLYGGAGPGGFADSRHARPFGTARRRRRRRSGARQPHRLSERWIRRCGACAPNHAAARPRSRKGRPITRLRPVGCSGRRLQG